MRMLANPFNYQTMNFIIIGKFLLLLVVIPLNSVAIPQVLTIGGLFNGDRLGQELAFQIAVQKVYSEFSLFSSSTVQGIKHNVSHFDSFEAQSTVCKLLQNQVAAIIDTTNSPVCHHVEAICDNYEIPHIRTRYDWQPSTGTFSINLYPHPLRIARATIDLIIELDWKQFAVLYEDDQDIAFVNELFKETQKEYEQRIGFPRNRLEWKIGAYQFASINSYRDTFGQVRRSPYENIVLHVKSENLYDALKQAQQIGLMTDQYSFILTSLDLHSIDLKDFKYSGAKIHSYRIVDVNNTDALQLVHEWEYHAKEQGMEFVGTPYNMKTETALVYDAVRLVSNAIKEAEKSMKVETVSLSCDEMITWSQGTSILNFLTAKPMEGVTGGLFFDEEGYRSNVVLHLYELSEKGFTRLGFWSDINKKGLEIENKQPKYYNPDENAIKHRTLKVVTVEEKGYTMIKKDRKPLEGNDKYEGYVIDLVEELSKLQGFNYEINLFEGKGYGDCNKTTMTCTGMLGEITSDRAHLALVDLTITAERAEVVDFTHPFINTGISVLYKKIIKSETQLFGFLSPFSKVVWCMTIITVLAVSFVFHVIGRLSPYEWVNPYQCRQDEDILENDLTVLNTMWFIVAALMQQGSEIAPRTLSTRWLAGVWYFFTLILVSCYTANLAASLAIENFNYPFASAKELITKNTPEVQRIKFGCKSSGSTLNFFKDSQDPIYRQIYEKMIANPEWLARNNDEGENRVRESDFDYAFFMESATIDYKLERNCSIVKVGGLLDHKGYGIGVKRNSPLLRILNQGLLSLQESGQLQVLYDRWWKQRNGGGVCSARPSNSAAVTSFKLINVGGVFIVLLICCAWAMLIAVFELICKKFNEPVDLRSFASGVKDDLKFALNFRKAVKPVRKSENLINRSISEDKSSKISNFSNRWPDIPRSP